MSEDHPESGWLRPGSVLAGYRIESRLGSGGMAVVFRARDERLGRLVALKVMSAFWTGDQEFRQRFLSESRAAATVDHPHVIPVYEAGEADGELFIAMRLVSGSDLQEVARREGTLAPARALDLLSPVASALEAAHAAGLVHRDVKPANILIDQGNGRRPDHVYLSDFGLAKGASAGVPLTGTGHYLGTPQYSSPEQVRGLGVDGRADQYALACVAFQLLAGRVPFERDNDLSILYAHVNESPPTLTEWRPDLPAAADAVLARALAKEPADRYPACQDFTEALRAALGFPSYFSRDTGPSRRVPESHPATVAGQASAAPWPVTASLPDVPGPRVPPTGSSRVGARDEALRDEKTRPAGRWTRRRLAVGAAASVVVAAAIVIPLAWPAAKPADTKPGKLTLTHPAGSKGVNSLTFSPDGRTLAAADGDGRAYLWDVATGRRTAALADPGSKGVWDVAFSPDGRTLATSDRNGSVYLWDAATDRRKGVFRTPALVYVVAFSPDGRTLAAADGDGRAYLWDVATGRRKAALADPGSNDDVIGVAFSPDGRTLATADSNGSAYLWNVATGRRTAALADPDSGGLWDVAFSPDGRTLATADSNGSAYLWDVATRRFKAVLAGSGAAYSVRFSPDGKTLAVADNTGGAALWDVATGQRTVRYSFGNGAWSAVFSPGGKTLAVGDAAGSIHLRYPVQS